VWLDSVQYVPPGVNVWVLAVGPPMAPRLWREAFSGGFRVPLSASVVRFPTVACGNSVYKSGCLVD